MYARLQAEETLDMINAVALGNGCVKQHEAKTMIKKLVYQTGREQRRETATLEKIQAVGFGINIKKGNK